MSKLLSYLEQEHARLETEMSDKCSRLYRDDVEIARLKKLKLAIKDQIARWSAEDRDGDPSDQSRTHRLLVPASVTGG
jgi:hypothetical protein